MLRIVCRSVLHNLVVTHAEPFCHGSIRLDPSLMEKGQLVDGEQVLVANVTTGARMSTYAVQAPRGSGMIETSGSMSRLARPGDTVCVMSFALTESPADVRRIDIDFGCKPIRFRGRTNANTSRTRRTNH
jgi:aspartate 1-decarboxylase